MNQARTYIRLFACLVAAAIGLFLVPTVRAQETIMLVGSGSTVPQQLYTTWSDEFNKRNSRVQIRYLAIGTSESIQTIAHGSGDFGAGEVQLSAKELGDMNLKLVPTALVAIVPIYNLAGVHETLRFSGKVLAEIYLGEIRMWNDPRLARLNPGIDLPNVAIKVVYRAPGKGSNYIFSDYLSKVSPRFRAQVGRNASPKWPVGVPTERSIDMAKKVSSEGGTIGYVELNYAIKTAIKYGAVQNPAGQYVRASTASLLAACQNKKSSISDSFSVSLTNAGGLESVSSRQLDLVVSPGPSGQSGAGQGAGGVY